MCSTWTFLIETQSRVSESNYSALIHGFVVFRWTISKCLNYLQQWTQKSVLGYSIFLDPIGYLAMDNESVHSRIFRGTLSRMARGPLPDVDIIWYIIHVYRGSGTSSAHLCALAFYVLHGMAISPLTIGRQMFRTRSLPSLRYISILVLWLLWLGRYLLLLTNHPSGTAWIFSMKVSVYIVKNLSASCIMPWTLPPTRNFVSSNSVGTQRRREGNIFR